ncbi:MAG: FecR domain-containing protein [Bacteroidales bacterium]|nr:FecR domain-containing protein [Bacteroidales bacterium]
MKTIKDHIKYSKLLAAKVLDELDDDQKAQLSRWEAKAENRILESKILNAEAFNEWSRERDHINMEEQWSRFIRAMQKARQASKNKRIRVYKVIASVAAVLIIGFTFFYTHQVVFDEEKYQSIAESHIEPGTTNATLIVDSGEIYDLTEDDLTQIKDGDVSIVNTEGILSYDNEEKAVSEISSSNTLIVPRGGEYQLQLADGTKVWLNSESELTYPVLFTDNERKVQLKGEAYFEVSSDQKKPFIVDCEHQSIKVMGTAFNVSAYTTDNHIITTLVEGKVMIHAGNVSQSVADVLLPDEQLILNTVTKETSKQEVDTRLYTSWKDGRFKFRNESLESFMKKVSRWYDVEIVFTDEGIKNMRFTGDLPRYKDMSNILKIMIEEMSVSINIQDNKIIYVSR